MYTLANTNVVYRGRFCRCGNIRVFVYSAVNIEVRRPGSSVGIATAHGLDGPGIESRWGEIFRTCPDRP